MTERSSSLVWLVGSSREHPGPDRDDKQRKPQNDRGHREDRADLVRIADPEHDEVAG
jgi:hypothetical protein